MHKKVIEYKFNRGDTVYFIMFDRMQCTTVTMVIAIIRGEKKEEDGGLLYVVDETKIVNPEAGKKYSRYKKFENYFKLEQLYATPEEATAAMISEMANRTTPEPQNQPTKAS